MLNKDKFLEEVTIKEIKFLYYYLDDYLRIGDFSGLDMILLNLVPSNISYELMTSTLRYLFQFRHKLDNYDETCKEVRQKFIDEGLNHEDILRGLLR